MFVGDFSGSDDGARQRLGCGVGSVSRSFRRVRWLSRIGCFVVGESELPAQGVMRDDDDLVGACPISGVLRRRPCILPL